MGLRKIYSKQFRSCFRSPYPTFRAVCYWVLNGIGIIWEYPLIVNPFFSPNHPQKNPSASWRIRGFCQVLLEGSDDFINDSVDLGLFRGHEEIPVCVVFNFLNGLARVFD